VKRIPRVEKLEGKEIDVLVASRSLKHPASRVNKFRGIQSNEVKAPVEVSKLAQNLEDISLQVINLERVKPVDLQIAASELHGACGRLHLRYMVRSASQCPDPESAGIGKAVEDRGAVGIIRKGLPVLALVQVETCFVAFPDVHKESARPFLNLEEIGRQVSPERARA
jgi:hypothetical protein